MGGVSSILVMELLIQMPIDYFEWCIDFVFSFEFFHPANCERRKKFRNRSIFAAKQYIFRICAINNYKCDLDTANQYIVKLTFCRLCISYVFAVFILPFLVRRHSEHIISKHYPNRLDLQPYNKLMFWALGFYYYYYYRNRFCLCLWSVVHFSMYMEIATGSLS